MPAEEVKQYITFLCKREEEGVEKRRRKDRKKTNEVDSVL